MTRKDFVAIACIIESNKPLDNELCEKVSIDSVLYDVARDLAEYFTKLNPNFDRARFMSAAGFRHDSH